MVTLHSAVSEEAAFAVVDGADGDVAYRAPGTTPTKDAVFGLATSGIPSFSLREVKARSG